MNDIEIWGNKAFETKASLIANQQHMHNLIVKTSELSNTRFTLDFTVFLIFFTIFSPTSDCVPTDKV